LGHEKLLDKFRELKIYERKIKKAKARNQKFDLKKLVDGKPTYSIDHILKERYPRFLDAVNDLDDALCLISLFASLPKHELLNIKSETISECQRLLREFYLYCAVSKSFRKGFISIKGIYMNVEVMNYDIVWLSPIHTQQKLTFDVDYEIMSNFLELYISLMKFVNLKLFKDIGMDYPPPKENYDMTFFGLNSLDINKIQNKVGIKAESEKNKLSEEVNLESEEMKKILELENQNKIIKNLFKNCVFYISREVPSELFGLAIMSAGGVYGDESENSPIQHDDPIITHYIVDRPKENMTMVPNKEYIQPQWILDCVNSAKLISIADYEPSKKLPAHISPFYEFSEEGHIKVNKKLNENETEEKAYVVSPPKKDDVEEEDEELKEMLMSKNKKKMLERLREEKNKKKKVIKIKNQK